jgi:hypothetical protein
MDKSLTTIITSCTIESGETTALSDCTYVDASRATQLIFTLDATINAAATEGLTVYFYTSVDNSTWDDYPWDSWEIPNCRQVGFTSGDYEFMFGETLTAQAGGTATVIGWSKTSGEWADGDAAGTVYLQDISGTFTDTQSLTGGTSGCSATQDGSIAAHAITRTGYPIAPNPLYIKARIQNDDTGQSATLCKLGVVKQAI